MRSLLAVLALMGVFFGPPALADTPVSTAALAAPDAVVLAVDTSDSMWGAPLTQVQAAAQTFVDSLPATTPVALVQYDQSARVSLPFTLDRQALSAALAELEPGGVSALYDGALLAVETAADSGAARPLVIFLSDGSETPGQSVANRDAAARLAQTQGVSVHTVSLGSNADRAFLADLARFSGGSEFAAPDATSLNRIYASLSETLTPASDALPSLGQVAARPLTGTLRQSAPAEAPVSQSQDQTAPDTGTGTGVIPPLAGRLDDTAAADPVPVIPPQAAAVDPANTTGISGVVLAVDISDSMWGAPLNSLKAAARQFVTTLDTQIPVALVTYGNEARIAQSFTTDNSTLMQAIDSWQPGGVTALYDGAALSVALAAQTPADGRRIVVLLSDGGEYGGQSSAARDDALLNAQANGVEIVSIALGFGADTVYLGDLASSSGGRLIEAAAASDLNALYRELAVTLVNPTAPTPDTVTQPLSADIIAPLSSAPETDAPTVNLGIADDLGEIALPGDISPLNDDIMALGLDQDMDALAASGLTLDSSQPQPLAEPDAIAPDALQSETVVLDNPIRPIIIEVDGADNIVRAELALNDRPLTAFDGSGPYRYDLDTSRLISGDYQLTLTARNQSGVTTVSTLNFAVAQPTQLPRTGGLGASTDTINIDSSGGGLAVTTADGAAPRVLLVEGQALQDSMLLTFNTTDGLTLNQAAQPALAAQPDTLADILMRPAQLIPEPIRAALTHQNPQLATFVIIAMSIILLPQGLFTIYWMTYTWVMPERGERSASPTEFLEPQYSFTAMIPARKEELVIRNTIHAVHAIEYPDELKEILILVRDEDDDETIAEAKRAIAEIRREYVEKGQEYPDHIHLVTFTDGPKNKPNGLNRGHQVGTKSVMCIFDAEDTPHPEIYQVVNTVMQRDGADVVQSGVQLMNFESNWFSALNVLEYFFWFKSGLHAFTHDMRVTPLGGNTVFFKTHWLDQLAQTDVNRYAWDQGCLTEDADVGIRLTKMGASIQIVYDAKHATQEETPGNAEEFIKQRTRWCQGFYEIFFKGDWVTLPTWKQRITAIYILLNSLLQASIIFFLPLGIFIALTQRIAVPVALLSYIPIYLLLTQLVINLMGIREFTLAYGKPLPFGFRLKMLLFYYPFQLMLSVSAMRAVVRFLQGSNSWEKTSHANLHRNAATVPGGAA